jgi:putative solute:sodium symporter small subunit
MNDSHSRTIIYLLAGILAVLLVGRTAALGAATSALWIVAPLGAGVLVVWVIVAFVKFCRRESALFRDEVLQDKRAGRPWLHYWVGVPGGIGNFVVFAIAALYWLNGDGTFRHCLEVVPFWWVPILFVLASIPVRWIELLAAHLRSRV